MVKMSANNSTLVFSDGSEVVHRTSKNRTLLVEKL